MKISQIIVETTTAGSIATVSEVLGTTQTRPKVNGLKPINQLGGKKKGPYANSLNEGAMKQLSMDLKELRDDEFKKKYGKTKQEARATLKAKPEPVSEAKLDEEDKIITPGKGHKLKPGLLNKPENSMNPTDIVKLDIPLLIRLLEFAREDAQGDLDLHDLAEKLISRGSRGKTLSMKDYEYVVDECMSGGVIAGGPQYESYGPITDNNRAASKKAFNAGVRDGKAGAEKNKQYMASALMKTTYLNGYKQGKQGVVEGEKVDRMVKHVTQSEKKLGHSKKEAENIAWATANKRGMLDNKNKKKVK